jgi:photosystem II stability/assembly factor-like uncharacterized protein
MKTFSRRVLLWTTVFVLLVSATVWLDSAHRVVAQNNAAQAELRDFELLDTHTGWVWHGDDLDWTSNGGVTWRRVTPGDAASYRLAGVRFVDQVSGWALLLPDLRVAQGVPPILLARTANAGTTWHFAALPEEMADALLAAKALHLAPLGIDQGWVAANLASSSNFSRGALWYTDDGGATWQERTLPLGEAVQFSDAQTGWIAGGPSGDAFWRTQDGGFTWSEQPLPRQPLTGEQVRAYTPLIAVDGRQLVLPLLVRSEAGQELDWYRSADDGTSWEHEQRKELPSAAPSSVAANDARAWLLARAEAILPPVQPLPYFANTPFGDGRHLVQVKMATAMAGWAKVTGAERNTGLVATRDGGLTWQIVNLPESSRQPGHVPANALHTAAAAHAIETVKHTTIARGPGFDACNLPSLAELATWYSASPYRIVNLYIGGVLRYCSNENLKASTLSQLSAQGWTFIPTWVGPQAPCSVYRSRFDSNPGAAYTQGIAEAEAALAAAKSLGLSEADGSGTIIYYDMESFNASDQSCIAAAQAFVAGWTSRLHERGSQSGLYGSACSPRIERYASIAAPPDAVWVAQWNRSTFDPDMTVAGIFCLDDSLWARSQRIRQYTGGHDETWGGVTLNIDSNVVDGLVADLKAVPPTPVPTPTPTPMPTATPTLQPTIVQETPKLEPMYGEGMCGAGWHMLTNARGYPAYLAANSERNGTIPPAGAALSASWQPAIPADGYYRVEAYIPGHEALQWLCPDAVLASDTSTAYYAVRHADGVTTKMANQAAVRDGWLLLGVYPFRAGLVSEVRLDTATDEEAYTHTVAASALRVTHIENGARGSEFLYLPQINRR